MLKYLSGIENESDAALNGWFQDAFNSVKSGFQNAVKNVTNFANNLPKITLPKINMTNFSQKLKKVGVAPARAAFLTLVRLNVVKMADRLADAYRLQPTRVRDLWVKGYGGNWDKLKQVINAGTKGGKINGVSEIGIAVTSIIATVAAALPILAGTIALVKSIRGNRDAADALADQSTINDMAGFIDSTPIDQVNSSAGGGGGGFDTKTLLLIGGAGVAAMLLLKKK